MSIAQIVETLQQQLSMYNKLLTLENDKTPLIKSNDIIGLNVLTQKEKLLLEQADKLEQVRNLLTSRYFKEIGFRYRSGILSDLIKSVSNPEDKEQLSALHHDLTSTLNELKKVNELNQKLIQQSLDFINFSINLMIDDPNEDVTYQHPMNQLGNKRGSFYDSKK